MQFNVSQRFSFTPNQLKKTLHMSVFVRRAAFKYTNFSKKFVCVRLDDFSSKSVNFLFCLFSI